MIFDLPKLRDNLLGLSDDQELFRKAYVQKNLKFHRTAIVLAMIIYIGFGYFHSLNNPYMSYYIFAVRLGIVAPIALGLFALSFCRLYERYSGLIFAVGILIAGVGMIFLIKLSYAPSKYYFISGLVIIVILSYTLRILMPWPIICGWSIMLVYNVVDFVAGYSHLNYLVTLDRSEFLYINFYLLIANIFGTYISYNIEVYEKEGFFLRRGIEEEEHKSRMLNIELEEKVLERTKTLEEKNKELKDALEKSRRMEESLKSSKEKYVNLINNIEEACFELDLKGRFILFNPALGELVLSSSDEIQNSSIWDYIDSVSADTFKEKLSSFFKSDQKTHSFDTFLLNPDGTRRRIELVLSKKMESYDDVSGFFGIARDITKKKQIEQSLRRAKKFAEGMVKIKSKFLENINLELRSPLNVAVGFSHLLSNSKTLSKEDSHRIKMVSSSLNHMSSLVEDLMDFSKAYEDDINFNNSPFIFGDILSGVKSDLVSYYSLEESKLNIVNNVPDGNLYLGDRDRLIKIFRNIAVYGLDCSGDGNISLSLDILEEENTGDLFIFIIKSDHSCLLESFKVAIEEGNVKNDMTGIEDDLAGGLDLGFTLARLYVKKMGGSIKFFHEYDGICGLEIRMFFTRCEKESKTDETLAQKKDISSAKVLVVEDNLVNQKVIEALLNKKKAGVNIVSNGLECLDFLENNYVDIILMDIQMPVMDGITAAREIRAGKAGFANRGIPIIAVTAHAIKTDKRKCMDAGMDDYITKPVKPEILYASMEKFLK